MIMYCKEREKERKKRGVLIQTAHAFIVANIMQNKRTWCVLYVYIHTQCETMMNLR